MNLKKFDIVLVDFPFSNLTKTKKRPALVISSLEGENSVLCQITTKRRNFPKYEVYLPKSDERKAFYAKRLRTTWPGRIFNF
jgi:mRNA interferase MazF